MLLKAWKLGIEFVIRRPGKATKMRADDGTVVGSNESRCSPLWLRRGSSRPPAFVCSGLRFSMVQWARQTAVGLTVATVGSGGWGGAAERE